MPVRPSSRPVRFRWPTLALIVLIAASSCTPGPAAAQESPRSGPAADGYQKARAPKPAAPRRQMANRPDPRYRPPAGLAELQAVAGEVARTTGRRIQWRLVLGKEADPLIRVRGDLQDCTITIHPVAARKVPPNIWAFLFGHEFAHLVEKLGTHAATNPATELKADIAGARYAMAAGYRLDAFLGWVMTEPDHKSATHGSLHQRVREISKRYGISRNAIVREAARARTYRSKG